MPFIYSVTILWYLISEVQVVLLHFLLRNTSRQCRTLFLEQLLGTLPYRLILPIL